MWKIPKAPSSFECLSEPREEENQSRAVMVHLTQLHLFCSVSLFTLNLRAASKNSCRHINGSIYFWLCTNYRLFAQHSPQVVKFNNSCREWVSISLPRLLMKAFSVSFHWSHSTLIDLLLFTFSSCFPFSGTIHLFMFVFFKPSSYVRLLS